MFIKELKCAVFPELLAVQFLALPANRVAFLLLRSS